MVCHLLTGCNRCRKITSKLWPGARADRTPAYLKALDSALQQASLRVEARKASLQQERDLTPKLEADLLRHPAPRRLVLALNSRRFCNWFLCERILDKAFEAGFDEPATALELAELGVALAGQLSEARYGSRLVSDMQARAWAALGNARRIASDQAGAEEALQRATALVEEEGTGDPLEVAGVHFKMGTLRMDQRRFDEALRLFDRASQNYRRAGDDHLAGRVLAEKAMALGEAGKLSNAIQLLEKTLGLLDEKRDPRAVLVAKHNLSRFLQESGQLEQALALLTETVPAYTEQSDAMNLVRLRWLEGKLALAQGQHRRAEEAFLEVRTAFIEREIGYDAALVSLNLAAVYVKEGRTQELQTLAAEMLKVFGSLQIHREALAAYMLFQRAVEAEGVSLQFLRELTNYLEKARKSPELRFVPPD